MCYRIYCTLQFINIYLLSVCGQTLVTNMAAMPPQERGRQGWIQDLRNGVQIISGGARNWTGGGGGSSSPPFPSPSSFPFPPIPSHVPSRPSHPLCHFSPSLLHPFPFSPFPHPLLFHSLPIPFPSLSPSLPVSPPCHEAAPLIPASGSGECC